MLTGPIRQLRVKVAHLDCIKRLSLQGEPGELVPRLHQYLIMQVRPAVLVPEDVNSTFRKV